MRHTFEIHKGIYAQKLNRIPGRKTVPSHNAVDKIYQILQDEGLAHEWKEEMMYGG